MKVGDYSTEFVGLLWWRLLDCGDGRVYYLDGCDGVVEHLFLGRLVGLMFYATQEIWSGVIDDKFDTQGALTWIDENGIPRHYASQWFKDFERRDRMVEHILEEDIPIFVCHSSVKVREAVSKRLAGLVV